MNVYSLPFLKLLFYRPHLFIVIHGVIHRSAEIFCGQLYLVFGSQGKYIKISADLDGQVDQRKQVKVCVCGWVRACVRLREKDREKGVNEIGFPLLNLSPFISMFESLS